MKKARLPKKAQVVVLEIASRLEAIAIWFLQCYTVGYTVLDSLVLLVDSLFRDLRVPKE